MGSSPLFLDDFVEGRNGDLILTPPVPFGGKIKCETNGQSRDTGMKFHVFEDRNNVGGFITFLGPGPISAETNWKPESFDLTPDDVGDITLTLRASLFSADNFVRSCIGLTDTVLTITGEIHGDCTSAFLYRSILKIEVRTGNILQLTGSFSGFVSCDRDPLLTSPPPGTGSCKVGTEGKDKDRKSVV